MLPVSWFKWSNYFACALMFTLYLSCPSTAQDKRFAAVTSNGVPQTEQEYYFGVLKDFSTQTIEAFLTGLGLSNKDVQKEMGTVDLNILGAGNCLAKYTLSAIYQALQGGCVPRPDDAFIFSIILPKFAPDNKSIVTSFFPYGINQLKSAPASPKNIVEYVESYPSTGGREWTEALIVVSFLNLYWENVKSKPSLTDNEFAVVYKGFGQYQGKLTRLCAQISDVARKNSCKSIAADADAKSILASQKPPL